MNETAPDELALMRMGVAALFTHDAAGRILTSNESDPERAPRLFLGRTPRGHVWRVRDDVSAAVAARIDALLEEEPPLDLAKAQSRPVTFDALRAAMAEDGPVSDISEGPAWLCPASIAVPTGVLAVGPGDEPVLREHFSWTAGHLSEVAPCFAVVEDGRAVAIAFSARLTPNAAEAGVNTVEAFRGRGYAARAVAAWANAVRSAGRVPLYSTSWDNLASQAVARKLGLALYGVEMSIS